MWATTNVFCPDDGAGGWRAVTCRKVPAEAVERGVDEVADAEEAAVGRVLAEELVVLQLSTVVLLHALQAFNLDLKFGNFLAMSKKLLATLIPQLVELYASLPDLLLQGGVVSDELGS